MTNIQQQNNKYLFLLILNDFYYKYKDIFHHKYIYFDVIFNDMFTVNKNQND